MSGSFADTDDTAGGAEGDHDGASQGSGMDSGVAASQGDLAFALRTVAEALKSQQKMQEKLCERLAKDPDRSRVLAAVKLPEFDGHPSTSVRKYREWKKELETIKLLNKRTDTEFALIMFSQIKRRTKDLLECLELPDVQGEQGLQRMWTILDDAFEQMEHERFAAAWRAWEVSLWLTGSARSGSSSWS